MILVELVAYVDALAGIKTFYLSTARFVTSPTDTPAHTAFEPALEDPGTIGVHVFADGATGGKTELESGEIVLKNQDGQFDDWLNHGFDGRLVVIRKGPDTGGAYPGDFPAVFVGTSAGVDTQGNNLIVKLRDRQYVFDQQVLTKVYGGTNVLPNGVDGTANDIKGRTVPKTFGKVFNIEPPCVNTSKLVFQVNDGPVFDIPAVYDRGKQLTKGTDYASSALLLAATLTSGTGAYATCLAEGYFRLPDAPAGQITSDVTQGNGAGDRTAGQILRQLAVLAGLTSIEIEGGSISDLDAANSAEMGVYINGEDRFADIMDTVAQSVGGWYGFDNTGLFRVGRIEAPLLANSVLDISEWDLLGRPDRRFARDDGLPVYRVTTQFQKVWTVQKNDFAGVVTQDRRTLVGEEYRSVVNEDLSTKNKFALATTMTLPTLFVAAADASVEGARQLVLFKVRRDIFEVVVPIDLARRIGVVVTLFMNRFGLSGGKPFVVLGLRYELKARRAVLTLWG